MIYDAQGDVIGARNNGWLTGSCAPSKRNNLQALKDAFKIHLHAMKHPKPGVIQKKNKCCYLRTDPSRERRCNAMSNVMGLKPLGPLNLERLSLNWKPRTKTLFYCWCRLRLEKIVIFLLFNFVGALWCTCSLFLL
jgi:hypothetical protein